MFHLSRVIVVVLLLRTCDAFAQSCECAASMESPTEIVEKLLRAVQLNSAGPELYEYFGNDLYAKESLATLSFVTQFKLVPKTSGLQADNRKRYEFTYTVQNNPYDGDIRVWITLAHRRVWGIHTVGVSVGEDARKKGSKLPTEQLFEEMKKWQEDARKRP